MDSCSYPLERELDRYSSYRKTVKEVLSQYPSISTFDPSDVLCKDGVCKAVIKDHAMYIDSNHLSESGSNLQGAAMKKQLTLR